MDSRGALGEQTNLAVSLRGAGRASDAAGYLERAYALLQVLGERRPETLACQLSRAINLLALDDEDQAYSELVAVKEVYEDTLGSDHPHTIACMTNLAAAARARGESTEAVSYARASASAFGRVLGADHPYTLAATSNLAICSAEVGDMTTAALVVDDVTLRTSRLLGDAHPDTLRCRANRALILRLAGEGGGDVARLEAEVVRRLTDTLGEALGQDRQC